MKAYTNKDYEDEQTELFEKQVAGIEYLSDEAYDKKIKELTQIELD